MGVFRELGRRMERFKQDVEAAADDPERCPECDEPVRVDAEACPACGADVTPP